MTEIEVAFMIFSQDHAKVIDTLRDLILNQGYLVEQKGSIKINDTYFDKPNKILEKKKIGLRIRTINEANPKLTLKIPEKSNNPDYSERTETEKPWSRAALKEVISTLNLYIDFSANKPDCDNNNYNYLDNDPKSTLLNWGFKLIQNRETNRNIINAMEKKSGKTGYEFAIDTTTYIINGHRIITTELEIELKNTTNDGKPHLTNFNDKLKNHNELFQLWPYSKLVTGKAIENRLVKDELKEHDDFNNNNILTYSGIRKIISEIKLMDT